jgi:hypothetical protein
VHAFHRLRAHPLRDPNNDFQITQRLDRSISGQCTGVERSTVLNDRGSQRCEHVVETGSD